MAITLSARTTFVLVFPAMLFAGLCAARAEEAPVVLPPPTPKSPFLLKKIRPRDRGMSR